jgi:sulfur relay protein TusB/DsrH
MADVFLLTKAPSSSRSELCFQVDATHPECKVVLSGRWVYHLLNVSGQLKSAVKTMACGEDILARGLALTDNIVIPDDFYRELIKDIMENSDKVYVF